MKWRHETGRRGATLVFFAIALPVILAMSALVVDVGELYVNRTQLQTAADQGALAGCQDISGGYPSETKAKLNAENFAKAAPGRASDSVAATVIYTSAEKSVNVQISRQVNTILAKVFGETFSTVRAVAKAQVTPATGIPPGAPPFVIQAPTNLTWQGGPKGDSYSQYYYMKINPSGANQFTYVDVVFKKPTSYADYLNLLSDGYANPMTMQTTLYHISPAAGGQGSVESFASRLSEPGNTDPLQAQAGDARLMLVPIVTKLPTTQQTWTYSTKDLGIVGFIGFWFDAISFDGKTETTTGSNPKKLGLVNGRYPNFYVKGRFVRVPLPPGSSPVVPGQQWYGTGAVRLVK